MHSEYPSCVGLESISQSPIPNRQYDNTLLGKRIDLEQRKSTPTFGPQLSRNRGFAILVFPRIYPITFEADAATCEIDIMRL
jgi:hypothetical protein